MIQYFMIFLFKYKSILNNLFTMDPKQAEKYGTLLKGVD